MSLVLYLDAGNSKSYPGTGTVWTDLSGNNNNGTLTNGPTYNSSNGGSIVFDGTDDSCTCGALSPSFTSFTVCTWFYPTSIQNYKNVLDCNYLSYTSGNIGPRLEMNDAGTLGWVYSNISGTEGSYYSQNVVSSGLSANQWHFTAISYSGLNNSSITYYNGINTQISRGTSGTPTGYIGSMNSISIGRGFSTNSNRIFAGRVSSVSIYNRALTPLEIFQNFNAFRGRYGL